MPYEPVAELYINDVKQDWWESIEIGLSINAISDITVVLPNDHGQFTSKALNGSSLKVLLSWDAETPALFWTGEVEQTKISKNKESSFITLWGRDEARIIDDELTVDDDFVPYSEYVGDYGGLMKYLIDNLSNPLTYLFTQSGNDISINKTFDYQKTFNEMNRSAERGDYEWFYNGKIERMVIRPPRQLVDANIVKTFLLGNLSDFVGIDLTNIAFMSSDIVTNDSSDMITRVKFEGLNGVSGVFPSTQPTVVKEHYEQSDDFETDEACLQASNNYYNAHQSGRISLGITVPFGDDEIGLGDIIKCDDSVYGLSLLTTKLFRIISLKHKIEKAAGWSTAIGLGDFTPRITDFL